jgi:predicted oxidoreductase (fatty acid repression mutant protein)
MATAPQDYVKVPTSEFIKAIGYRRTVYPLSDKVDVSDDRIEEIVKEVLSVAPSSYNNQPMRVAIMLGGEHKKLWKIIRDQALPLLQGAGEQVVAMMTQRFDMFEAAYGSVSLFTPVVHQQKLTAPIDHLLGGPGYHQGVARDTQGSCWPVPPMG